MGYSNGGGKNSVTTSYSLGKNSSLSSKNSVLTNDSPSPIRATKKLNAARGIKEVLDLLEQLQGLEQEKVAIEKKIENVTTKIDQKLADTQKDPSYEVVRQYLLRK
jgi:hypothetical protein